MKSIIGAARFVQFLYLCGEAYIAAGKKHRMFFGTLRLYGNPTAAVIVARDREAWRVSDFYANASHAGRI